MRAAPSPATAVSPPAAALHGDAGALTPSSSPAPAPAELPTEFGWRRMPSSLLCEPTGLPHGDGGAPDGRPAGFANVQGRIDKEAVRRGIQAHIPEVQDCYEAILKGSPPFPRGRVRVRFAIDGAGQVRHSCVVDTTLGNATCERCIADAVLGWRFPKPVGGGWVVVVYPFVLEAADDGR